MVKNLADGIPHTFSLAQSLGDETRWVELKDPAFVIGANENAMGTRWFEVRLAMMVMSRHK